jgi:excisionase family DNA binding protein
MDAQTLSIPKACHRLGISAATGRQLVSAGEIPTIKIGKRLRVPLCARSTVTSLANLGQMTSSSAKQVRRFLQYLQRAQIAEVTGTHRYTIITILKWSEPHLTGWNTARMQAVWRGETGLNVSLDDMGKA